MSSRRTDISEVCQLICQPVEHLSRESACVRQEWSDRAGASSDPLPCHMSPWAAALAASSGLTAIGGSTAGASSHDSIAQVSEGRIAHLASSLHRRVQWQLSQGQPKQ